MPVLELIDDLATVVELVRLQVIAAGEPARPAGVECVKRSIERELAQPAIAQVRVVQVHHRPASEGVHVGHLQLRLGAVDVVGVGQLHPNPRAEQVEFLQLHTR